MNLRDDLSDWIHDHSFDAGSQAAERGTRIVAWITFATMLMEVAAGWWFNSMALLADGWHMGSHVVAIGLSSLAYAAARRHAADPRYAFGSWKIEVLAGFASAVFLIVVAAMMAIGSLERLLSPQPIEYREAVAISVLGLVVNLACALILARAQGGHSHAHHAHTGHGHGHGHSHEARTPGHSGPAHAHHHGPAGHHHPHDLNLKSAYLHVVADAATSVLAIVALLGGWFLGWGWLDPVMGLVGAVIVAIWARGLVAETARVLLDREMDHPLVEEIRSAVESDGGATRVTDLHVWRVGRRAYCCALTVVTRDTSLTAAAVRRRLAVHGEVAHSTIEVHHRPRGPD